MLTLIKTLSNHFSFRHFQSLPVKLFLARPKVGKGEGKTNDQNSSSSGFRFKIPGLRAVSLYAKLCFLWIVSKVSVEYTTRFKGGSYIVAFLYADVSTEVHLSCLSERLVVLCRYCVVFLFLFFCSFFSPFPISSSVFSLPSKTNPTQRYCEVTLLRA